MRMFVCLIAMVMTISCGKEREKNEKEIYLSPDGYNSCECKCNAPDCGKCPTDCGITIINDNKASCTQDQRQQQNCGTEKDRPLPPQVTTPPQVIVYVDQDQDQKQDTQNTNTNTNTATNDNDNSKRIIAVIGNKQYNCYQKICKKGYGKPCSPFGQLPYNVEYKEISNPNGGTLECFSQGY